MITKGGIPIENRGKGEQCFIKSNFALQKHEAKGSLHALLLEEPENHLSHTNMKRLVERLANTAGTQLSCMWPVREHEVTSILCLTS